MPQRAFELRLHEKLDVERLFLLQETMEDLLGCGREDVGDAGSSDEKGRMLLSAAGGENEKGDFGGCVGGGGVLVGALLDGGEDSMEEESREAEDELRAGGLIVDPRSKVEGGPPVEACR